MAPFRGKLVLFGGRVLGSDSSETWEWDGQNWSQRTLPNGASPPARSGAVLSPLGGKLVLFGGTSSEPQKPARYLGDTWEWDGERWTQRSPRSSPPARNNGHMAPLGNRLVLFGGFGQPERDAIGEALSDTWEWDGENWSPKSPALSPSARSDAAFATFRGKLLLHGGTDYRSESFDDTWTWDGQRWSRLVPSRVPPTRRGAVSGTIP
jgi:N-acetylneuraminic acid mutarotase